MKTVNLTAMLVGTKLVSRRPPAPEMCIVVRGRFRIVADGVVTPLPALKQGTLSGDTFAPEDADQAGAVHTVSDLADFKPNTDLLLQGKVHPPGGTAVKACRAVFAVGGWQKAVLAMGERVALHGGGASEPKPFTRMPITWDNAFGGPGLAANPAGRGWGGARPGELLPTIGPATEPARPPELSGHPACLAPVSPYWATRRDKMGRNYGRAYQDTRAPFFSDDFDWTYFNAAPADQQVDGRLKGDEWLRFVCLSPQAADLRTRLPDQLVRAVVRWRDGTVREVPMVLDTLLAQPDAGTVTLTWRGHAAASEEDLADVAALLVAAEDAGAPRVPLATYVDALDRRGRKPTRDRPSPRARAAASDARSPLPAGPPDPLTAQAAARLDGRSQAGVNRMQAGIATATALGEARGIDLRGKLHDAANRLQAAPTSPPHRSTPRNPVPRGGLAALRNAMEKIARTRSEHGGQISPEGKARLDGALDHAGLAKLLAGGAAPPPDDFAGDMRGRDLGGRDLSGRDLSGFDLTGCRLAGAKLRGTSLAGAVLDDADLSGADLTGAMLPSARLARAVLRHAVLKATLLADADLAGADLSEARVSRCPMSGVRLAAATLVAARLWRSDLSAADLGGADLSRATVTGCDFSEAKLDGVRAVGSTWRRCTLHQARAAEAVLNGSVWRACACRGLVAPRLQMARCRVDRSGFADADLSGASFFEAEGQGVNWSGGTLHGADFRRVRFPGALFIGANADKADFTEADLSGARFRKAKLGGVRFEHAKLLGADFDMTELQGVAFDDALLFKARFYKVRNAGSTFDGADLTRAIIVQR